MGSENTIAGFLREVWEAPAKFLDSLDSKKNLPPGGLDETAAMHVTRQKNHPNEPADPR